MTDAYVIRRTDIEEASLENLRKASRSLVEFYGADRSIGNDERTAHKHYLRTTDERFARASSQPGQVQLN